MAGKIHSAKKDEFQFVLCGYDLRGSMTMIDEKTGKQTQRPIKPEESVWYKYEQLFTDNYKIVSGWISYPRLWFHKSCCWSNLCVYSC